MTTQEKVCLKVRDALAAITSPALSVDEGVQRLEALPPGRVQLTPLGLAREPGAGGRQIWHLGLLIAVVERLTGATGRARWGTALDACWAVLGKLDDEATRAVLRGVGGIDLRRGDMSYWSKPPGGPGDPAGGLVRITIDFVE